MKRTVLLVLCSMLVGSVTSSAQQRRGRGPAELAAQAERVVVGSVDRVAAVFTVNEFGDRLIVSRASIRTESVLKDTGTVAVPEEFVIELEGGTVGDVTLDVSDLPRLERGERAVFFTSRNGRGTVVPHGRGEGILKLDRHDRVIGTSTTLADIQEAVGRAR